MNKKRYCQLLASTLLIATTNLIAMQPNKKKQAPKRTFNTFQEQQDQTQKPKENLEKAKKKKKYSFAHLIKKLQSAARNGNAKKIKKIAQCCSNEEERIQLWTAQDEYGKTVFHYVASNWDLKTTKKVIKKCPKECKQWLLRVKDNQGNTPLHCAASNWVPETVKLFLNACTEAYRPSFITMRNYQNRDAYNIASTIFSSNKIASEILAFNYVIAKDTNGLNPLHRAIENNNNKVEVIKLIKFCPGKKRADLLLSKDSHGRTALNKIIKKLIRKDNHSYSPERKAQLFSDEEFINLIKLCPQDDFYKIMAFKDKSKETVLHKVIEINYKLCTELISLCPEKNHDDLLMSEDIYGKTLLHVTCNELHTLFEPTKKLIELCSKNKRDEFLMKQCVYGETALHKICSWPGVSNIIKLLIESCTKEKQSEYVLTKSNFQSTALHETSDEPEPDLESMKMLIKYYPKKNLLSHLLSQDEDGNNFMHKFILSEAFNFREKTIDVLKAILEQLPKNQKIEFISAQDRSNDRTILSLFAEYNPYGELFEKIMELYPQKTIDEKAILFADLKRTRDYFIETPNQIHPDRTDYITSIKNKMAEIVFKIISNKKEDKTILKHITNMIDNQTNNVPKLIEDYYTALTTGEAPKRFYTPQEEADIEEYFHKTTPQQLPQKIEFSKAARKIGQKNKISKDRSYQIKNMKEASQNSAKTFLGYSLYKPDYKQNVEFKFDCA